MKLNNYEKAVLYLLGERGFFVFENLIYKGFKNYISKVIIGRDKGVVNDYYFEIKSLAEKHKIPFHNRVDDTPILQNEISLVISWKWLFKDNNNPIIVLHDSILPKYRGFNPLVTALVQGDNEIGVSAIIASEGVDEGPIINQKSLPIKYPLKIQEAIHKIKVLYRDIVLDIFDSLFARKESIISTPQINSESSFSLWRDEQDYFIDWTKSSSEIQRFIDAVGFPYDGAKTRVEQDIIRINESQILPDLKIANRTPGKLLNISTCGNEASVVCNEGILRIKHCTTLDGKQYEFKKLRTRLDSL